jgi:hypothetical protein
VAVVRLHPGSLRASGRHLGPCSSGSGCRPFKAAGGVRLPVALLWGVAPNDRRSPFVIAWPSGKAAGCNPVHAGSIPAAVSSCGRRLGRCACPRCTATFATVAQWQSSGFQTRVVEGPIPSCRAGLPVDLERRSGYAAEWDGPHRAVNPDSKSAVGSIPTVPTEATG